MAVCCGPTASAQGPASGPDQDQIGAWYMYFFQKSFGESRFGVQGDYQFRFWDFGRDLEQVLLRTGVTYRPKDGGVLFTLGYANITTGRFEVEERSTVGENRIYQEALFGQTLLTRLLITHRIRYEQRWVENQNFRTRYRYNLFVNVPINDVRLAKGVVYGAFYNEIFINGQTRIAADRTAQYFDRNRTYLGLGYGLRDNLRAQLGWMRQTTVNWAKGQAQFSLHHNF